MGLREDTIKLLLTSKFDMNLYQPALSDCGTACCIAGKITIAGGLDPSKMLYLDIPREARRLWAEWYGEQEALRLQFTECGWGDDLTAVTVEEAIDHLNGADPVVHHFREDH